MKRPLLILILLLLLGSSSSSAQAWFGLNAGPLWGRTLEGQVLVNPKNEDWLTVFAGGGYTFKGGLWFPKKTDCLDNYSYGGWHLKFGLRNNFTTDHKDDHFFWALGMVYTRMKDQADGFNCDPAFGPFEQSFGVLSPTLLIGYSLNPIYDRPLWNGLKIDFGVQGGVPILNRDQLVGERGYLPGIGYRYWPFRTLHLEPFIMLRIELNQRLYGYFKPRKDKR